MLGLAVCSCGALCACVQRPAPNMTVTIVRMRAQRATAQILGPETTLEAGLKVAEKIIFFFSIALRSTTRSFALAYGSEEVLVSQHLYRELKVPTQA